MPSSCNVFSYSDEFIKGLVDKKKELDTLYDQAVTKHRNSLMKLQRVETQRHAIKVKAIKVFSRKAKVLSFQKRAEVADPVRAEPVS